MHTRLRLFDPTAAEWLLALILTVWGFWSAWPPLAAYGNTAIFLPMRDLAAMPVWGVGQLTAGGLWLWGLAADHRRPRLLGMAGAIPLWAAIEFALWQSAAPPPGAGITALYLLGTLGCLCLHIWQSREWASEVHL